MIESNRVSPPSSVGWPPRSRTLSNPSQRRSRLRCNGCELYASERGRGRVLDADVDEAAGGAGAGEVHGRVPPRASTEQRRIGAARALDEHLLAPADPLSIPRERNPLDDLDEALDPLLLRLVRNLVGHRGRLGSLARRVDEREGAVVADFLDYLQRLLEVAQGLAREADDDVRREREVGDRRAQVADEPEVALAVVRAPHRLEDPRRSRLERQARVLAAGAALRHRCD